MSSSRDGACFGMRRIWRKDSKPNPFTKGCVRQKTKPGPVKTSPPASQPPTPPPPPSRGEFELFPSLPTELRDMIWRYAMTGNRIYDVVDIFRKGTTATLIGGCQPARAAQACCEAMRAYDELRRADRFFPCWWRTCDSEGTSRTAPACGPTIGFVEDVGQAALELSESRLPDLPRHWNDMHHVAVNVHPGTVECLPEICNAMVWLPNTNVWTIVLVFRAASGRHRDQLGEYDHDACCGMVMRALDGTGCRTFHNPHGPYHLPGWAFAFCAKLAPQARKRVKFLEYDSWQSTPARYLYWAGSGSRGKAVLNDSEPG